MKTILEKEIEFPEVSYFNNDGSFARTVNYIDVPFYNEEQSEMHLMRIVRDEFEKYLDRYTTWLDFYDLATFYDVENRDKLRIALFDYIETEYFGKKEISILKDDLKQAHNTIQGYMFQVEVLQQEITRLKRQQEGAVILQSKINGMRSGSNCRVKQA